MSEYKVTSNLGDQEWQIKNQARQHSFMCDDIHEDGTDAGPNPVEYLTGAVNSCITMSAGMVIKSRQLPIKDFQLTTTAITKDLGHSRSIVDSMAIEVGMTTDLPADEQQAFVDHVLDVSTVYQTVAKAVEMTVTIAD
jgi:uncharacterized OsmC-like protein